MTLLHFHKNKKLIIKHSHNDTIVIHNNINQIQSQLTHHLETQCKIISP